MKAIPKSTVLLFIVLSLSIFSSYRDGIAGTISKTGWRLLYVDSQELVGEDGAAVNAFDGDPATIWHTEWLRRDPLPPHEIQIDLGDIYDIDGFGYLPIQENGNIDQYEFYVSANGMNWGTAVAGGFFANDLTEKEVSFSATTGRFVRLVALREVNGNPWTSMAELSVLGGSSSGNQAPDGTIDTPDGNITIDVGDWVDFSATGTDPDGNTPLTFLWDFGDPAIADATVEDPGLIQFNNSGVYVISFSITDSLGLSDPTPATRAVTVVSSGNQAPDGAIDTPAGNLSINVGDPVNFTATGTDPDGDTPLSFLWDFGDPAITDATTEDPGDIIFNSPGVFTVSFTVTDSLSLSDPTPVTRAITVGNGSLPISKTGWRLLYVDSQELVGEDGAAVNAFDGDPATIWHTEWLRRDPLPPHEIQIDLGDIYDIDGFGYLPIQENGNIDQYEFYVSANGMNWGTAVAGGFFANDLTEKEVSFSATTGRFVRLVALREVNGNPWTSMAELSVLGGSSSGNQAPDGTIDTPDGNITIDVGDWVDFSATGTDPDGNTPLTFLWDFGDPAIADATVEDPGLIQFNNSGVYVISFSITDSLGLSDPTPATRAVTVVSSGNQAPDGAIDTPAGNLSINVGDPVNFTATGTDPDGDTPLSFLWDFGDPAITDATTEDPGDIIFNSPGVFTVSFTVTDSLGLSDPTPAMRTVTVGNGSLPISKTGWRLLYVDSQELVGEDGAAVNAFDGDPATIWHTEWLRRDPLPPHEIQIDLGDIYDIDGFGYLPIQENGNIDQYEFYVSADGMNWGTAVAGGFFANDLTEKEVLFSTITGRFIRLVALEEVNGNPWTSMAELSVLGGSSSGNQAPDGTIDTPDGNITIDVGDWVDFSATGTDPDGNTPLTFLWDFGDPAIADATVEDPGLIQFNNSGVYVISFSITDSLGLSDPTPATRAVTVVSSGNQAPDGAIDTPAGNLSINVGDPVNFTATGTDPDGDTPLSFLWDFGDPAITDATTEDPGDIIFNSPGVFTVSFTVTDSLGLSDPTPAMRTVTVGNGSLPISKTGWRLLYVDSQELVGEDGAAVNAFDGDPATIWHTEWLRRDPLPPHEIQIDLGDIYDIDGFRYLPIQENGNIDQYEFYVSANGIDWGTAVAGGFFANDLTEKEVLFSTITGRFIRLVALEEANGNAWTSMAELSVLGGSSSGNQAPDGTIDTPDGNITIDVGDWVDFSATGTDPDGNTPLTFLWDFGDPAIADATVEDPGLIQFNNSGVFTIVYTVFDSEGLTDRSPAIRTIIVNDPSFPPIDQSSWDLLFVDSQETVAEDRRAIRAFDGNDNTFWHTEYLGDPDPPHPHEIQIDLGSIYEISGFRYTPSQENMNGRIGRFEFYLSLNGIDWGSAVATGSLENDPLVKEVKFTTVSAQYVRFVALSEVNNRPWTTMAELNVLGATFSGNLAPNGIIEAPSDNISINIGDSVNFSATGTDPDNDFPLSYYWNFGEGSGVPDSYIDNPGPVQFNTPGTFTVFLTVSDALGRNDSIPAKRVIKVLDGGNTTTIPQTNWSLLYVDSEELVGSDGAAVNAFDGMDSTLWHTQWFGDPDPPQPHEIQIDLESAYEIDAFRYLPSSASSDGRINHYEFFLSTDNLDWGLPVATGNFADDELEKYILFSPKMGRFIRLVALDEVNGNPWTSMAEINIEGQCETPYVSLVQPQDFFLQSSPNLTVTTSACLNSTEYPGWGVKIIIDGGSQVGGFESTVTSRPFEATFTGLSNSEHTVEAVIVDDLGQEIVDTSTYDTSYPVGIGGYYVAIGDSITAGVGDDIAGDNISWDGRNKAGGYTPILNNLLSQQEGYPHTVEMAGVPGYTSLDGLQGLPSVLSKHPNAQKYLLMFGTNDAAALLPLPSGLGLYQGDTGFAGSYKDTIQQMINMIHNDGKDVFLAKIPFTLEQSTNIVVQEYNQVIDELVIENNILVIPPDFYSYFETHQNELINSLHPSGNGYQSMAAMWLNALQ